MACTLKVILNVNVSKQKIIDRRNSLILYMRMIFFIKMYVEMDDEKFHCIMPAQDRKLYQPFSNPVFYLMILVIPRFMRSVI